MTAGPESVRSRYRWLAALCATAICIALAFHFIDLGTSADMVRTSNPWLWALTVALSMIMAGLRAARVAVLARPPRIWPVVKASFLHNAANAVLPARIGDAALPIALKQYAGLDLMRGFGLLLVVRLCDLTVLGGLGLVLLGLVDIWDMPSGYGLPISAIGAALCISAAAIPHVMYVGGRMATGRFGRYGVQIASAASDLRRSSGLSLVVLTLPVWLTLMLAAQTSAMAVGLRMDWILLSLASVAASLAFASPINGVASIGPFEAAFAGVLVSGGAPVPQAIAAAVVLHLSALAGVGIAVIAALVPSNTKSESVACS